MKSPLPRFACTAILFALLPALLVSCMDRKPLPPAQNTPAQSDPFTSSTITSDTRSPDDTLPNQPPRLPEDVKEQFRTEFPIRATRKEGNPILTARLIYGAQADGTPLIYLDACSEDGEILGHILLPGFAQIIAVRDEGEDAVSGLRFIAVGRSDAEQPYRYCGGLLIFSELNENGSYRPAPAWIGLSHQGQFRDLSPQSLARVELLVDAMLTEHFFALSHPETDFGTPSFSLLLDSYTDEDTDLHSLAEHADAGFGQALTKEELNLTVEQMRRILSQ